MVCKCLDVDREACTWAQACSEWNAVHRADVLACLQLHPVSRLLLAGFWRAAAAGAKPADHLSVPDVQCARAAAARAGDQAAQHRRLCITHVRLLAGLSGEDAASATAAHAFSLQDLPVAAVVFEMSAVRAISLRDCNAFRRHYSAVDARTLRAAVGTFCDLLGLATRTLEAFGPGCQLRPDAG